MRKRRQQQRQPKKQSRSSRASSLRIEQLEQRMMLTGDSTLGLLADGDVEDTAPIQPVAVAPIVTPVSSFLIAGDDIGWGNRYLSPKPLPDMPEEGFQSVEEVRDWVTSASDTQYGHFFDESFRNYWHFWACDSVGDQLITPTTFDTDAGITLSGTNSFTGTNVQVEGVDEADLMETDGEYLYLVSGKELIIVDARDSENLSIASRVQLKEQPTGIYLSGDRLTLISGESSQARPFIAINTWNYAAAPKNLSTTVTVLDLSDRTAPTQVQKTELQGRLVSSRMVDGQLRLVLSQQRFALPTPKINYDTVDGKSYSNQGTYESRAEYLDRVLEDAVDSLLSSYQSFSVEGEVLAETQLVGPHELREIPSARTTIATFDVHGDDAGPADIEIFRTEGATEIYATEDSLYVFEQSGHWRNLETSIRKFDFDDDHSITLAATGSIEGRLLNQFSVDEHDGFLRVVTGGNGWNTGQSLSVLEQVGDQLKMVGSVDDLAPGEILHSVRFMGEQAFVVTFQKVDPLFAIDLSDPTNPTVAGELKIPGYSDYLQPLGEDFLLGIGRDADIRGGLFREMQLSIFNVSDLDNPQLAHRFSLEGGRSTASIALGNRWRQGDGDHHAVSYFPSEQILALPIHSADAWGGFWGGVDNTPIFELGEGGLQLFSVDTETGFESLGIIEHDSPILRSLKIGEALFAFSAGEITTHDLTGSIQELDSLQLLVGSDTGLVELTDFNTIPAAAGVQATVGPVATRVDREAFVPTVRPTSLSQLAVEKALLSVPLAAPSVETIDSVFSTGDPTDMEDFRLSLDDLLMDDFLADFLGQITP